MVRRLFLFFAVLGVALAGFRENMHKCGRFMRPGGIECCTKKLQSAPPTEDLKECFQMQMRPPSCEREICIGKKRGFATDDGKLDKKAFVEAIEKDFDKDPDVVKAIKEKCVDGDINKFAPSDFCDLVKVKFCTDVQLLAMCPEWDDKGPCAGAKEDAAECVKLFA